MKLNFFAAGCQQFFCKICVLFLVFLCSPIAQVAHAAMPQGTRYEFVCELYTGYPGCAEENWAPSIDVACQTYASARIYWYQRGWPGMYPGPFVIQVEAIG
jgi:hypothetical protein